jgi:hypothetical protein
MRILSCFFWFSYKHLQIKSSFFSARGKLFFSKHSACGKSLSHGEKFRKFDVYVYIYFLANTSACGKTLLPMTHLAEIIFSKSSVCVKTQNGEYQPNTLQKSTFWFSPQVTYPIPVWDRLV